MELAPCSAPNSASFFRHTKSDAAGIELPVEFSREFERISLEKEFRNSTKAIGKGFRFPKETSEKFFNTEKASPELMALGASLAESNPLKAKAFREEDLMSRNIAAYFLTLGIFYCAH